jgi:hypothetical protein
MAHDSGGPAGSNLPVVKPVGEAAREGLGARGGGGAELAWGVGEEGGSLGRTPPWRHSSGDGSNEWSMRPTVESESTGEPARSSYSWRAPNHDRRWAVDVEGEGERWLPTLMLAHPATWGRCTLRGGEAGHEVAAPVALGLVACRWHAWQGAAWHLDEQGRVERQDGNGKERVQRGGKNKTGLGIESIRRPRTWAAEGWSKALSAWPAAIEPPAHGQKLSHAWGQWPGGRLGGDSDWLAGPESSQISNYFQSPELWNSKWWPSWYSQCPNFVERQFETYGTTFLVDAT